MKLQSPIKWVGGKKRVIPEIEKLWPKEYNTYYEPFIGGGSVLFHFQPEKAVINDLNTELINMYRELGNPIVREYLLLMEQAHIITEKTSERTGKIVPDSPFYRLIAGIDRVDSTNRQLSLETASNALKAARFIFLNKNCFNGLYRVNAAGFYNTPSKHKPTKTFDAENICNVSSYLDKHVDIRTGSFDKALDGIKKGDFVYLDPPYDYEVGTKGFDSYQKGGFGVEGQQKLLKLCKKLDKMGVKFMMSNHSTELINELYSAFNIKQIQVSRFVGGKNAVRKPVGEVLITNYNDYLG